MKKNASDQHCDEWFVSY